MSRLAIALLFVVVLATAPALAAQRAACQLCGMYIDQYQRTAATLVAKDGSRQQACGVADMIRMVNDAGGPDAFSRITVHDWQTGGEIDAAAATYVIGSDLVPDMLPTVIAFARHDDAEAFQQAHGGKLLSFTQALLSIAPMGMTMPSRIRGAVTPPRGALKVGAGYMTMVMDELMIGSDEVSTADYFTIRGGMMAPEEMRSHGTMYMVGVGLTDDLTLMVKTKHLEKEMTMVNRMGRRTERHVSGMTDTDVNLRYNVWKDATYSRFLTLTGGVTLPTGDWREQYRTMPGLQLGIGTVGWYGGLLASARFGDFWLHGEASHLVKPSYNDYDFGDVTTVGLALHYTPNYDLMLGLETDYTHTGKDENRGVTRGTSGGDRANLAVVASWRFLTAMGGNCNLKVTAGVPYYADLNDGGLGTKYFANAMLSFSRRFNTGL